MCFRNPSVYSYLGTGGGRGGTFEEKSSAASSAASGVFLFLFFFFFVLFAFATSASDLLTRPLSTLARGAGEDSGSSKRAEGLSPEDKMLVSAASGGDESHSCSWRSSALKRAVEASPVPASPERLADFFFFFFGFIDRCAVFLLFFLSNRLGIAADGSIGGDAAKLWNCADENIWFCGVAIQGCQRSNFEARVGGSEADSEDKSVPYRGGRDTSGILVEEEWLRALLEQSHTRERGSRGER
mmetsp:Transcript_24329/g.50515  ORF Transcript_24329/g.50515 Transcript_24329/m.50515 type:complete len:242 (+) Transcript_24329:600-1325(+)